ncbi:MAG: hypothetical protein GC192_09550 [Bacteroidetes bacterium]|nr:hypothetical protein [Bacteroidota bacterium]
MSYDLKTLRLALVCCSLFGLQHSSFSQNYSCPGALGPNVFPDGTLGSGTENILPYDPGISPGYWYTPTPPPVDGAYCVANSTDGWTWFAELFWLDIGDNSPDSNGYMMVVNADYTPGIFYERTVSVCENTPYIFSADIINLFLPQFPDAILPNVDFLINGNVVYSTGDIPMNMQWHTYEFAFTAPAGAPQFTFALRNNAPGGFGNDLALDNISLRFCGPKITLPAVVSGCGNNLVLQPNFEGNPWQNAFYQWQTSLDGGQSWSNVSGANSPTILVQNAQSGQKFRLLMAGEMVNLDEPFCRAVSSIATIEIPVYQGFMEVNICQGESFPFAGNWYSSSGIYQIPLATPDGCDSLLTLDLTVHSASYTSLQAEICEGESFSFVNQSISSGGDYQLHLTNSVGCDSIVTLQLTVHPKVTVSLNEQICEGSSYYFDGQHRSVSGDYVATGTTVNGCDSTTVLHLEVLPQLVTNLSVGICEGGSYWFDNQALKSTGFYQALLQTEAGCDSLVTLDLVVEPMIAVQLEATICEGSYYDFGGQMLSTAGNYEHMFQTAGGCDSLVSLSLSIATQTTTNLSAEICEGGSFVFGNDSLTSSGTYQQDLTGFWGCDSAVVLVLTVLPVVATQISENICEGGFYIFGNQQLTSPGQYEQLFQTPAGCDSLVTLNLSILPKLFTNLNAEICEGNSFPFGSMQLDTPGTYQQNLIAENGCDSLVTLTLSVLPITVTNLNAQICEGEIFSFGNLMLNTPGQYSQTYQTWEGCDSLVTLQLQVWPILSTDVLAETCEGVAFKGHFYEASTILLDTLSSVVTGCDSIVHTHLTVWPIVTVPIDISQCWGETFAGHQVFSDTTMVLQGQTTHGCDSFTVCSIKVAHKMDVSISGKTMICAGESTELSAGNFHEYHWSNGESASSIVVKTSGEYQVTVSNSEGCTASSSHFLIVSEPKMDVEIVEPRCHGERNGELHLDLHGGIQPFRISYDGGDFSEQKSKLELVGGMYEIIAKDSIECTLRHEVYLPDPPVFEVAASESQTVSLGESVTLDAQANLPISKLMWSPPLGLSCNDCQNPVAMPFYTTEYLIEAVSEKGCLAQSSVQIVVNKEDDIYVPNSFSPNGDGINDFFTLYPGKSVSKINQFLVFDRWGEQVFGIWNAPPFHPSTHWQGDFRDLPAQTGVFVWLAEIEYIDGRTRLLKGDVVLMK